jgi:hypothetical protein
VQSHMTFQETDIGILQHNFMMTLLLHGYSAPGRSGCRGHGHSRLRGKKLTVKETR